MGIIDGGKHLGLESGALISVLRTEGAGMQSCSEEDEESRLDSQDLSKEPEGLRVIRPVDKMEKRKGMK